ncbi:MAG: hypothetical protein RQ826_02425 [Xanthomonadales bacterium]|nr:hypothetical protein [Xanthomonadales bacterium]
MIGAFRPQLVALLCGLLPFAGVHLAYLINLSDAAALRPEFHCMPYWEGCVSISRAARSGEGLHLFRALVLPAAALMVLTWLYTGRWLQLLLPKKTRQAGLIGAMGAIGALFLIVYASWLGTDGPWYGWLRRYGVIFYFGLTALAQLLLLNTLWPSRKILLDGLLQPALRLLFTLVALQWAGGVFSSLKRLLLSDPLLIDRLENTIEWSFALSMSAGFLAIGWLFRRSGYVLQPRTGLNPPDDPSGSI